MERAIQRRKDEKTFQKEFAKDMRKINKIRQEKDKDQSILDRDVEEEKQAFA